MKFEIRKENYLANAPWKISWDGGQSHNRRRTFAECVADYARFEEILECRKSNLAYAFYALRDCWNGFDEFMAKLMEEEA